MTKVQHREKAQEWIREASKAIVLENGYPSARTRELALIYATLANAHAKLAER